MNYIQKAWLKVLGPVVPFINEKLAKRSGLLGKLGRMLTIGPREYGFHPINKLMLVLNRSLVNYIGFYTHRYSVFRAWTQNGYSTVKMQKHQSILLGLLPYLLFTSLFLAPEDMLLEE
jgi:hypothetical protein